MHCQAKIACGLKYITPKQFEETDDHINRVSYLLTRFRASITN